MKYLWLWITLGVAALTLFAAVFVWLNNRWLKVTRYRLRSAEAPRAMTIVQISDLHGKSFGRFNQRLVRKVADLSPDFIAVTGDIIHRYRQRDREVALSAVSSLKEIAPVLYISGNHELRNIAYRFLRRDLKEAGAVVLDNATAEICGVSVTGLKASFLRNGEIGSVTPSSPYKILLAHEPQYFERYAAAGYDVVLCGHAHGGQWRIPFTGVGLYAPGQGLFPKYTSGCHRSGRTCMIVSRGLGNSKFPLRLFNRPEIVVVEIGGKVKGRSGKEKETKSR